MTTQEQIENSFLGKLIDWKEFEIFVSKLYKESDEVLVEHNITQTGKSGTPRQIDVKITQRTKLHTYITLVECKRWKSKVDHQVIEVLSAKIEDLNASKGVVFTTKGYEEGAVNYAKFKNIDIFVIRDLAEEEWGAPGRFINFYIQLYGASFQSLKPINAKYFSFDKQAPPKLDLALNISKDQKYDEQQTLFADLNRNDRGPNLIQVLFEARVWLLKNINPANNQFNKDKTIEDEYISTKVLLDFTNYKYKYLVYPNGVVEFNQIEIELLTNISTTIFNYDRGKNLDFVLIVENYITNQKNFVSRTNLNNNVILSDPIMEKKDDDKKDALINGSVIRAILEPYVSFEVKPGIPIKRTNDVVMQLGNP